MQVQMQGLLGHLGRTQAEASEQGFIQDLSLGLGSLGWPQKALAKNGAYSRCVGVVSENWAELQNHVYLQLTGED